MHNEPQISNAGEWGDVTTLVDNKGRVNYRCRYCEYFCRSKDTIIKHTIKCINDFKKLVEDGYLIENTDFVICKICNLHGKSLGIHINKIHNLKIEEYKGKFGQIICRKSSDIYAKVNKISGDWINRAKENGENLTPYFKKMGEALSKSIMANPQARKKRAETMAKVNQSDVMRQKASETAKKTSVRPEIQAARSAKLQKWRDENPDAFYEQCIKKMISSFHSKPELKLFEFMSELDNFNFKLNRFIQSEFFNTSTNNRQIDMGDEDKKIFVEFDGVGHFKQLFTEESFNKIKEKDKEVEKFISKNKYLLIRVSYDQYVVKTTTIDKIKHNTSYFKETCLQEIMKILSKNKSGIYKIGEAYGKYKTRKTNK